MPQEGKTGTHKATGRPVVYRGGRWVYTDSKVTEDSAKAQTYARLMAQAEQQYQAALAQGYDPRDVQNAFANFVEQLPFLSGAGAVIRDDSGDAGKKAERLWLDAQLKAMTGAGQSKGEEVQLPQTYFPRFGEPETDDQTYEARRTAFEAARRRAGPVAAELPRQYPGGPSSANDPLGIRRR